MPTKRLYHADPQRYALERQQWRKNNPEKYAIVQARTQTNHRLRKKALAYQILGDKCKHCGFEDIRALQIDHINGGGHLERRTKSDNTLACYRRIIAGSLDYQLLCANCNWIKRSEMQEYTSSTRKSVPILSSSEHH